MCLLEFLRKSNNTGKIVEHIRKEHARSGSRQSLEAFAVCFETFGEKVIATEMVSMLNDHYYGQWAALHVPFKKIDDLLIPAIVELVPDHLKYLACALEHAPHVWRSEVAIRAHMAERAHNTDFVETVIAMIKANTWMIGEYLDGRRVRPDAAPAMDPMMRAFFDPLEDADMVLSPEQLRLEAAINKRVDQAMRVRSLHADDAEMDELMGRIEEHASMVAGLGPPGCGKTVVLDRCIRRAQDAGARVLVALPTGAQRARMRAKHQEVDLDTCHGAFLFHKPAAESMGIMMGYELIVIDEAPQLLDWHFSRLVEMWLAAGKVPCVVFAGDEWQLPPPSRDALSLIDHPRWAAQVSKIFFKKVFRQDKDDPLAWKLDFLRKSKPMGQDGRTFIRDLCKGHKAWSGHHQPTADDISALLEWTDQKTTVITCTRWGAALVNELCVQVLFLDKKVQQMGRIPCDYEANPDNFDEHSTLLDRVPEPLMLPIYLGLRVRLTRNMDKRHDYVNGMSATVEDYNAASAGLVVKTETNLILCIYPVTEQVLTDSGEVRGRVVYYPLRAGYADTVHKYQGAELEHVTFWPDRPGCQAAGYVALSRVKRDKDYLLGGCIDCDHFVPAR